MTDWLKLPYTSSAYGVTEGPSVTYSGTRHLNSTNAPSGTWTVNQRHSVHYRSGKTSNPVRTLTGTITKWRDPSSYLRVQNTFEFIRDADLVVTGSWYHKGRPLDQTLIDIAYSNTRNKTLFDNVWPGIAPSSGPNVTSFDVSNIRRMADTKALNDLAGAKANLGEALATVRQTVDLFLDNSLTLLNFARKIRSGRFVKDLIDFNPARVYDGIRNGSIPKSVANRWLQFHYGWRPLASDVYGSYELLREQLLEPKALLVHGRGKGSVSYNEQTICSPILTGASRVIGMQLDGTARIAYVTNITGRVQSTGISRAVNEAGLVNPLQLAWELVPFSFVVDWVVPIGSVLSALSATAGLDFVGGSRTLRFQRQIGVESDPRSSRDGKSQAMSNMKLSGFERTRLGSFPTPAPYVKPFYTGADRFATIAALVTSLAQFRSR